MTKYLSKEKQVVNSSLKSIEKFRLYYEQPENTVAFGRDILGYKDLCDSIHQPVIDMINKEKSCLFLLPRGHLKSTLITITRVIQEVIINPDIRIYLTNAVLPQSIKFLREIKEQMSENRLMKELWPDVFWDNPGRDAPKWTEDEIIVKRKIRIREATITVGSVAKETTGSHYDLHIYDDLVNRESVGTPEQIEKTLNWYRASLCLLEPGRRKWLVGTRWDYSDMYGTLLNTKMPRIIRQVIEDGKVIFPAKFTKEILQELRETQGSYLHSCNYYNNPVDPTTAPFKRKYLQFWDKPPNPINVFVLVDLAISTKDDACETAIEVVGYSTTGDIYCLEDCSGVFSPLEIVEHLYRIDELYNHPAIGVERMQLEKALKYWLAEAGTKYGRFLSYYEMKPDMDKIRRIRTALQPYWEQYKVWLKPGMEEIENQFLKFPRYNKRDRIDALAYLPQLAYRPELKVETVKYIHDYGRIYERVGDAVVRHPWKPEERQRPTGFMTF